MAKPDHEDDEETVDPKRLEGSAPPSHQEPADVTSTRPDRSEGEDPTAWTQEEARPPAEDRQPELSEAASGPVAPERAQLENWNRDELLEHAAELGINVDPKIDRQALIDKLSRSET